MKKLKNKKALITVLVIVIVLLATLGISVAIFSFAQDGDIENSLTATSSKFKYTELTDASNAINIEDADPISDADGKVLNTYFDFKIDAKTTNHSLMYQVVVEPTETNTMDPNNVKVYLTELDDQDNETEVSQSIKDNGQVKKYFEYDNTDLLGLSGKAVYVENIPKSTSSFTKRFRIRMWIAEGTAIDTDGLIGSVGAFRVNVYTDSTHVLDALHLTYISKINPDTNLPYTSCTDIQCAIDELYQLAG